MVKVLGIIGGMGPLATAKLFNDIVLSTQAVKDQDHIPILIDNNTKIPSRPDYILDNKKENPKYQLISSAKKLEAMGADILVMPCNTAHYFYKDIINEINIPFINMIEVTLTSIRENYPNIKKVGLLATVATIKAQIYEQPFRELGIELVNPDIKHQKYITNLIGDVKRGKSLDKLDEFKRVLNYCRSNEAELFISGCTEISIALEIYNIKGNFIDPTDILIRNIIRLFGKKHINNKV